MISTNSKKLWLNCWSQKDHGKNYKSIFFKNKNLNLSGFMTIEDLTIE